MTTTFSQTTTCVHCGQPTTTETDFGRWCRARCGNLLSVQDVDYVFHRFWLQNEDGRGSRDIQYLMIVEAKTKGADMDDAQRDTALIIDNALRTFPRLRQRDKGRFVPGHRETPMPVRGLHGSRQVVLFGLHKLRMSGTRPDDSAWIKWDMRMISEADLIRVLRFELHPDTLNPMPRPRRHKKRLPPNRGLFD